jgi:Na+-driven multidrug efflux pump
MLTSDHEFDPHQSSRERARAVVYQALIDAGALGAWLAMACDQTARTFVIYFRYRSGHWKKVAV